MQKVIYFDLDGTLWNSYHPLLQTAWDRLPKAWEKVVGKLPDNFNWSKLAGSTDYAVVKQLVYDQFPEKSVPEKRNLIQQTIDAMDDYYVNNAPRDISDALFDDTARGLKYLKESGWTLGIITGNTKTVAIHKLQAAGLLELFTTDERFLFFGDTAHSRSSMIEGAWLNQLRVANDAKFMPPLTYIADTMRDVHETKEAMWRLRLKYTTFKLNMYLRYSYAVESFGSISEIYHPGYFEVKLYDTLLNPKLLKMISLEGPSFSQMPEREMQMR